MRGTRKRLMASVAVVSASAVVAVGVAVAQNDQPTVKGAPVPGGPVVRDAQDSHSITWIDPQTGLGVGCSVTGSEPIPASVTTPAEARSFCEIGDPSEGGK
jgi:hypothetical protein